MNALFRRWCFPLAMQLLTLAAFVLLILCGLAADTDDPAFAKVLRNTNLANLIVWSYWWPLIIVSAVALGRVWCIVCPMELLTSTAARFGLKRPPPRFLRSGWGITVFYMLILFVGVHTLAIHRVPLRMAVYLLALLGMAVVTGLLYRRTTFCSSLCPVGHLLGLYARVASFGWGVRDKEVCAACKDKSCVANATAYRFQGRSCGVGLNPSKLDDNTECLLCGQCLKACDQNNPGLAARPNPGWFRRPWAKDLLTLKPLTAAQTAFLLIVSGFVIYEILTEWNVTKSILLHVPNVVQSWLPAAWPAGWTKSLLLFAILPCLIWAVPWGLFRIGGGKLHFGEYACSWGIAFIPIMAAAHVAKSFLKMASRIPYWPWAAADPVGIHTARGLLDKSIALAPQAGWLKPVLTIEMLGLLAGSVLLSVVLVRKLIVTRLAKSSRSALFFYLIPIVYGGIFLVTVVWWRLVQA